MVVYADILVILNVIVDYFLIAVSAAVLRLKVSLWRQLAAALAGGLSSLYIFAPDLGAAVGFLYRTAVCAVMTLCAFGFKSLKRFLRSAGVLLLVTCAYGGIMTALWTFFRPKGMTVINSVVYFSISPAVLIGASAAAYLLYMLLSSVFSRTSKFAGRCSVIVSADNKSVTMDGIVDTGNSIKDVFGNSEVIIADEEYIEALFGSTDPISSEQLKKRYRIMPCSTVSGGGTLDGFRCDSATVSDGEHTVKLDKPILAVSKTPLKDDYQAIVNPVIFM